MHHAVGRPGPRGNEGLPQPASASHTSSGQDPGTVPTSRRRAPAVPLEHRPVALAPRGPPAWCTQVNTTQTRGNVSNRLASTGRNRLKPQARPSPLSAPTPHPRPHLVTHGLVAHFQEQRGGLGRRVTQQRRVGKPTKALWTRSPLIDPLAGQIPSYRESSPPLMPDACFSSRVLRGG